MQFAVIRFDICAPFCGICRHLEVVKLLVSKKADLGVRNHVGEDALAAAKNGGHRSTIEFLERGSHGAEAMTNVTPADAEMIAAKETADTQCTEELQSPVNDPIAELFALTAQAASTADVQNVQVAAVPTAVEGSAGRTSSTDPSDEQTDLHEKTRIAGAASGSKDGAASVEKATADHCTLSGMPVNGTVAVQANEELRLTAVEDFMRLTTPSLEFGSFDSDTARVADLLESARIPKT